MKEKLIAIVDYFKVFLVKIFKSYSSKLPYIIITIIAVIILVGTINIFEELTEDLKSTYLANYDSQISSAILSYRSPARTQYFSVITSFGHFWSYALASVLCALLFYWKFKSWKYLFQLVLVVSLALGSNYLLKNIIDRKRPNIEHLVAISTSSYPSGHAMISMAFYGFLIYLLYTVKITKALKVILIALCVFLILNIGISRIYLGVHFPSDIAAGWIAGFFWVIFCVMVINLMRIFRRDSAT